MPGFTFTLPDDLFDTHSPKADSLKAVKLTEDNLRVVWACIFRTTGERVEIVDGRLVVGDSGYESYRPGQWLVEDYDYSAEKASFRRATGREREKYDLR